MTLEQQQMKVGDKVKWMKVTQRGSAITFSTKYGTIESFGFGMVRFARVKSQKSSRREMIAVTELVPQSAKSQVMEVFNALVAGKEAQSCPQNP